MSSPAPANPPFHGKREVRFAVVIYGGVSLAIYINGIAQELLQMVRATATDKDRKNLRFTNSELSGSAKVYRQLGQLLGCKKPLHEAYEELRENPAMPVSMQFVIDVLSGTSAGGINAVFLSKALVNNQSLENLKNMWITEGDIDKLMNDRNSMEAGLTPQKTPQSLLNSQRMYSKLLDALTDMDAKGPVGSSESLVDELDLFTTATDIRGVQLPLRLSDKLVQERKHKNAFHFRYSRTFLRCEGKEKSTPPNFDGNDFQFDDNPFLAYAARCTSAFPFAFEPMALNDIFDVLKNNPDYAGKTYREADTTQWQRFYTEYIKDDTLKFVDRPFGDGGYLDNKPFGYAVDAMLKRFPTAPVDRKLLYVEPSPEGRSTAPSREKPDAFQNSMAALLTLPRYETIRQDLERILERNRRIRNVKYTVDRLREFAENNVPPAMTDDRAWLTSDENKHGVTYAAYQRLKTSTVIDELAEAIMEAFHVDADSGYGRAIRILTLEYFNQNCKASKEKNQFLLDFDRAFRIRKLSYTRMRIDEICGEDRDPAFVDELWKIRKVLLERFRYLIQREDMRCAFDLEETSNMVTEGEIKLILEPPEECADWEGLAEEEYPGRCSTDSDGMLCRAKYLLEKKGLNSRLEKIAGQVKTHFNFVHFADPIKEALKEGEDPARNEARRLVAKIYRDFEFCDSILFPIQYGADMGEADEVDVFRISPADAVFQNHRARRGITGPKLKGECFGAFGAFLDAEWRRHDILWGRLDGAERLISALLPGTAKRDVQIREEMIEKAHRAILEEELPALQADEQMRALADKSLIEAIRKGALDGEQKSRIEKLLDPMTQFREYLRRVPEKAGAQRLSNALARSTTIAGYMLEEKSKQQGRTGRSFRILAMAGRLAWSLVEAASPRSFGELLFNYLYQVAALCALVLLVIGLTLHPPLAAIALVLFGALLVLGLGVLSLRRRFSASGYWAGAVESAAVIVVLAALLSAGADRIRSAITAMASTGDGQAFWTACIGVLGAFAIIASIAIFKKSGELKDVDDKTPLPASPVLELEFAQDATKVNSVAGPSSHPNRRVLDQINSTDRALAISYGLFLLVLGAVLGMKAHMLGWIVSLGAVAGLADLAENSAIDGMLFASATQGAFRPAKVWARLKFLLLAVAAAGAGVVLASGAVVGYESSDSGWIALAVSGAAFLLSGVLLLIGQASNRVLTGGMGLFGVGLAVVTVLAFLRADLLCCELDSLRIVDAIRRSIT